MSDSVTKWHEMQDETPVGTNITYTTSTHPLPSIRQQAFTLLCNYPEEVIKEANKILNKLEATK